MGRSRSVRPSGRMRKEEGGHLEAEAGLAPMPPLGVVPVRSNLLIICIPSAHPPACVPRLRGRGFYCSFELGKACRRDVRT